MPKSSHSLLATTMSSRRAPGLPRLPRPALLAPLLLVAALGAGCSDAQRGSAPGAEAKTEHAHDGERLPPLPRVTDDANELLFSFVDAHGRVQAVPRAADVPTPVRSRVLVVDLARTPEERQAHRYAFFADLSAARPDGTYPVTVVSRYDAARGQVQAPAAPPPDGAVIVYSAAWCGFCKKAKAWLKEQGVPFVERDVEKTPGAQQELDQKLRAAGVPGGGVPVIDWAGSIVMGFDVAALERLKAAAAVAQP
jgi:glutaredoxin